MLRGSEPAGGPVQRVPLPSEVSGGGSTSLQPRGRRQCLEGVWEGTQRAGQGSGERGAAECSKAGVSELPDRTWESKGCAWGEGEGLGRTPPPKCPGTSETLLSTAPL